MVVNSTSKKIIQLLVVCLLPCLFDRGASCPKPQRVPVALCGRRAGHHTVGDPLLTCLSISCRNGSFQMSFSRCGERVKSLCMLTRTITLVTCLNLRSKNNGAWHVGLYSTEEGPAPAPPLFPFLLFPPPRAIKIRRPQHNHDHAASAAAPNTVPLLFFHQEESKSGPAVIASLNFATRGHIPSPPPGPTTRQPCISLLVLTSRRA